MFGAWGEPVGCKHPVWAIACEQVFECVVVGKMGETRANDG